jgi:hypothetical protein
MRQRIHLHHHPTPHTQPVAVQSNASQESAPLSGKKQNTVNLPENARVPSKNSVNLPGNALHFASKHVFHPIKSSQTSMVLKPHSTPIIQHFEFRVHACANMNFQSKLKINPHFSTENGKIANPSLSKHANLAFFLRLSRTSRFPYTPRNFRLRHKE